MNFAAFFGDNATWQKKSTTSPTRSFTNDDKDVPFASRRTAQRKCTHLELMLGQIENFCPVIFRNSIVKTPTSIQSIWKAIRMHYGFQSTWAHFLDFSQARAGRAARRDLYQRLMSFTEDNFLIANGLHYTARRSYCTRRWNVSHFGEYDRIYMVKLVQPDHPNLVKHWYCTDLRSRSLASINPEISQDLESFLEELHTAADSKVLCVTTTSSVQELHQTNNNQ